MLDDPKRFHLPPSGEPPEPIKVEEIDIKVAELLENLEVPPPPPAEEPAEEVKVPAEVTVAEPEEDETSIDRLPVDNATADDWEKLRAALEVFTRENEKRDRMFDELYQMIRDYRHLFVLESIEKPILLDLLLLYDTVQQAIVNVTEGQLDLEEFQGFLETIRNEIMEILYRRDANRIVLAPGEMDKKLQRIVRAHAEVGDVDETRFESLVRDGFIWRGRLLRPQEITVVKVQKPKPEHS